MTGSSGDFRRRIFCFPKKLGISVPDGLLEIHGRIGADCENLREPKLADYLSKRIPPVMAMGFMGKHGHRSSKSYTFFLIIP